MSSPFPLAGGVYVPRAAAERAFNLLDAIHSPLLQGKTLEELGARKGTHRLTLAAWACAFLGHDPSRCQKPGHIAMALEEAEEMK